MPPAFSLIPESGRYKFCNYTEGDSNRLFQVLSIFAIIKLLDLNLALAQ